MQATIGLSDGRTKLRALLASFPPDSAHWNEAQNRFQFIDRLLLECLGWEHPNIEVEHTDELGGRADYLLGKPTRGVLEAKREAKAFEIVPGAGPTSVRKLRSLIAGCPVLDNAVRQVIPYCAIAGAQLAVVCNGPQLVIFQALIPGLSPLDGEAFVFNGFKDYETHFPLLWRLLSPEGVAENRALREIAANRNPRIPEKARTAIPNPQAFRYRSGFQENLRALGSILLDAIEDKKEIRREFYKECYVRIEANNRHLLLSKNIISSRYKRVDSTGVSPARASASIVDGKLNLDESFTAGEYAAKPVVVIGDVGVGKTSFFENLFESLSANQRSRTLYININLGEKGNLSKNLNDFILSEVPRVLRDEYNISIIEGSFVEAVYEADLREWESTQEAKIGDVDQISYRRNRAEFLNKKMNIRDEHLLKSLEYLRQKKKKQIILIVDNADQRKFETQQEAFLIAQELAATRSLLVFVALRPSTFHQSKLTGALSGYQNRVLTISPPPADEVIRKRVSFAVRVAEGKAAPAVLEGVALNLSNIVVFLKAMLRSIRSSEPIKTFLSNITGGNTRLIIELISSFCGSPNVEAERIVSIERETGNYQVPLHEFTKHALLGEYAYFNALSSLVACNVFDIGYVDEREHHLCSLIVAFISSPMGITDNDGFVEGERILAEMMRLGFVDEQVSASLKRLATKRLIESPHGHYREIEVDDSQAPEKFHYRATSIGLYHIRFWVADFAFLDAISIDTPIFDASIRGRVFKCAGSHDIYDRLERAKLIRGYLEETWRNANFAVNYYDFPSVIKSQGQSFQKVENFIASGKKKMRH